mgnify:FL=1
MSLPMGERGLKQSDVELNASARPVAPYGGAWIETSD